MLPKKNKGTAEFLLLPCEIKMMVRERSGQCLSLQITPTGSVDTVLPVVGLSPFGGAIAAGVNPP